MCFILILVSFVPVFLFSCSDMWKLFSHTEEMMVCQTRSGPGGRAHLRGRTAGVLGWFFLLVHWKLWSAALWFTKKYQDSLFWPFSALQLEPVMDLGMEELKSSMSNSVIQVSNQLRVRLRGWSHFVPFLAATDGALSVRGQGWSVLALLHWAQAPRLFFLSVHLLFLPCLCLAAGGPEPKTETFSSLGCFSFLLSTSRYLFFFLKFQNILSIHSLIIIISRGFAFCVSKWRHISLSGFSLILNAAFKGFNSVLFQWYAKWLCCSLGENVFHTAFSNGLLQSKVSTHNGQRT